MTGLVALGIAAAVVRRRPFANPDRGDGRARLRAYLADHLTGSDAAFKVVDRLRAAEVPPAEAELFARLHREFSEERAIVRQLLHSLGGSPLKLKRLAGQAARSMLQASVGDDPGKLALFRALESLAVGVQGKRCLWRAAQTLEPWLQAPTARTFHALEAQAIDQWEHIERRRVALAPRTFAANNRHARRPVGSDS